MALTLAEKAIPHRREHIDLSDKPSWYLELNRRGLVPAIGTRGGEVLSESIDLCYWLDHTFEGAASLTPPGREAGPYHYVPFQLDMMHKASTRIP